MIWSWRTVCTCIRRYYDQTVLSSPHNSQTTTQRPWAFVLCWSWSRSTRCQWREAAPLMCKATTPLLKLIMHSTRSHSPPPLTDSSGHPCKKRSIAKMKKTVKFSPNAKLRSFAASGNDLQAQSSWFTAEELSSMKKRAKNLSILHYIKTRPGQPNAPSNRSGIVYNCHPAHYEIIGE